MRLNRKRFQRTKTLHSGARRRACGHVRERLVAVAVAASPVTRNAEPPSPSTPWKQHKNEGISQDALGTVKLFSGTH
jgi:hypothetical protein